MWHGTGFGYKPLYGGFGLVSGDCPIYTASQGPGASLVMVTVHSLRRSTSFLPCCLGMVPESGGPVTRHDVADLSD